MPSSAFTAKAFGLASPMIIILGVPDLLGALCTCFALRADARSAAPDWAARA